MSRFESKAALVMLLLALAASAWPEQTGMRKYPDSFYITHPEREGRKPPTYPAFVRLVKPGPGLVHTQSWISIASWCFLGFTLAHTWGAAIAGLLALSPLVRMWNLALLTESLSLSLLALFLALSLQLRRSLEQPRTAAGSGHRHLLPWLLGASWALVLLAFAGARSVHVLVIPFAALVLLPATLRGSRPEWVRFGACSCVLAIGFGVGLHTAGRSDNARIGVYTAVHKFVFSDPEALAEFREAGMPDRRYPMTAPMRAWLDREGRSFYLSWIARRPSAHATALGGLAPPSATDKLEKRYFSDERSLAPARWPWVEAAGSLVARLSAPPPWLWLLALMLVPLAARLRGHPLDWPFFAPIVLGVMTYTLGFASMWGAGGEALRHGLVASLLYRVAFAAALVAGIAVAKSPPAGHNRAAGQGVSAVPDSSASSSARARAALPSTP